MRATPISAPTRGRQIAKQWSWSLRAVPAALWSILSDTPRLNEALGLPPYQTSPRGDGALAAASLGDGGSWIEHGYEWAEPYWWRTERSYAGGPVSRIEARLALEPGADGGTHVTYTINAERAGALGHLIAATGHFEAAAGAIRSLSEAADRHLAAPSRDFFSKFGAAKLPFSTEAGAALFGPDKAMEALGGALLNWIAVAPAQDIAALRPRRIATALGIAVPQAIDLCILAVEKGVLRPRYDPVCQSCAAVLRPALTLSGLDDVQRCWRCRVMVRRDLAATIEAVFTPAEDVRRQPQGVYCASGPGTEPRIAFRKRLDPVANFVQALPLPAGWYRARAGEGAVSPAFTIDDETGIRIVRGETGVQAFADVPGVQVENEIHAPETIRIERLGWPEDASPASEVIASPMFRRCLPGEVLLPGQSAAAGASSIVFARAGADLDLAAVNAAEGAGAAVSHLGEGAAQIIALSADQALATAVALLEAVPSAAIGVDSGAVAAIERDGVLAYEGRAVAGAEHACANARPGEIVVTDAIAEDPRAAAFGGDDRIRLI